jgi:tRNA A-37 threonylcarbamoyl transferase component Bud32
VIDDHDDDDAEDVSGVFDPPLAEAAAPEVEDRARIIAGRYEIVERIGAGAMGQVLHVRHRRLGKSFALKLMQAELALHAEALEIFHREARLASALSHPGIVSIVDFGEDPDWGLFIVMEYLDGEPLSRRIEAGGGVLPVPVVCSVAAQLVDALHHSHSHDVVHGDLKSDNVFCCNPSGTERRKWVVKLLDFGMANLASSAAGHQDRVAGTPEYIAPERITGAPPRPSVDLYALGVIMYEMLAGSTPFCGDDPTEILQRALVETPEPVAARRGEALDADLVAIVDKALRKAPEDRYPDALSFGRDLRAYMDEVGLRARARNRRPGTEPGDSRADAAAAAFDALSIPAVGLRADGTIVVANAAFARLLRQPDHLELEGTSIMTTSLARLHRNLREDLRLVSMDGKLVRRRLTVRGDGDSRVTMRLVMTPAFGSCGHCILLLHSIPAPAA